MVTPITIDVVPNHLTDYIEICKKVGYEVTTEHCTILRRPLVPETHRRLGPERDRVLAEAQEAPPQHLTGEEVAAYFNRRAEEAAP